MPDGAVMHVITGLYTGGAERMLSQLALYEQRRGLSPVVVTLLGGGALADHLAHNGVEVFSLGMTRGQPDPVAAWRLARFIRRRRPDVIQSWMYHADFMATIALLVSGRRRATRFYWGIRCSNMDLRDYGAGLRIVVDACSWMAAIPDAVIANSFQGREFHRRLGYRPRRFLVIDNGVDTTLYRPDDEAREKIRRGLGIPNDVFVVASVARVDPMKGHTVLLDALGRLPGVAVLAIGDKTEELPERPGLYRLGERRDVPELLAASDAFVSSSLYGEGFSNAVVEAMAAGLPAVVTDVGDSRRIVGDTGIVVPPGDPESLARAMKVLANEEPEVRTERRRRARQRVEAHFSLAHSMEAFDALYRGTLLPAGTGEGEDAVAFPSGAAR
ncbi:MAG: glycosyltransferase [Alphaproteobacteria bacterium]